EQQPNFGDIAAMVRKYQGKVGALIKARALLVGNVPNAIPAVSFQQIAACVDAYRRRAYPNTGPCVCPPATVCPQLDACGRCSP
ncbi:MAG: hypothetical protein Q7R41_18680, partial [Phycisphaerales bacterium]|nr:hypothetical protein [Phycisphaerales bacterium]